jgi:4-amino-4-deoxy-L-arabinose transferase-like glycosyltransferase
MTLNGELLAAAPATVSIALALHWWRGGWSLRWLAAAGVLAGAALTMKQSGIDGLVVGAVLLVPARRWRPALVFAAGAAAPLLAAVWHGIAIGWATYWTALIGYQLSALGSDGANASTRWTDLGRHAGDIALDLTVVAVVAAFGWRHLRTPGRWVLGGWLAAGLVGVNLGGSYWPHYFVQLLPPLAVLAAAAVTGLRSRPWRVAVAGAVVLPTVVWLAALVPMSPARRSQTIPYDALAARDDRIAAVIRASTTPQDRIYVLESEAYLYFAADRPSPYPYLWGKPIDKIPDALPRLRAMLASPQRPTLVVLDTPPAAVDPSGGIAAALAEHYRPDTVVDGVPILRAR